MVNSYEKVRKLLFTHTESAYNCDVMFNYILTLRLTDRRDRSCDPGSHDRLMDSRNNEAQRAARLKTVSPYFKPMVLYIISMAMTGEEKKTLLLEALDKASEQKRFRLLVYICEDLIELVEKDSEERQEYIECAGYATEKLMKNIPEEFRESFKNRHGL